jgi:hypothetical protein
VLDGGLISILGVALGFEIARFLVGGAVRVGLGACSGSAEGPEDERRRFWTREPLSDFGGVEVDSLLSRDGRDFKDGDRMELPRFMEDRRDGRKADVAAARDVVSYGHFCIM